MKKYFCDKCNKLIKPRYKGINLKTITIGETSVIDDWDLCNGCYRSFVDFMGYEFVSKKNKS